MSAENVPAEAVEAEYPCQRVCEYAMDIGMPEYAGISKRTCGNCDHYNTPITQLDAPTDEEPTS